MIVAIDKRSVEMIHELCSRVGARKTFEFLRLLPETIDWPDFSSDQLNGRISQFLETLDADDLDKSREQLRNGG